MEIFTKIIILAILGVLTGIFVDKFDKIVCWSKGKHKWRKVSADGINYEMFCDNCKIFDDKYF